MGGRSFGVKARCFMLSRRALVSRSFSVLNLGPIRVQEGFLNVPLQCQTWLPVPLTIHPLPLTGTLRR
jgi:hypothetical protein